MSYIDFNKSKLVKVIALVVSFTFLHQQIIWSAEAPYAIPYTKSDDRSGFVDAERLQNAQQKQRAFIDRMQAVEDYQPKPSNIKVTTETGDIITYDNDIIESIKRPDGVTLKNVVIDSNGGLQNAVIFYNDGTVSVLENGEIVQVATPDATVYHYAQGALDFDVRNDGLATFYSYTTGEAGVLVKTVLANYDAKTEYDASGKINLVRKSGGTTIEYQQGMLSSITNPDGSYYIYDITPYTDGGFSGFKAELLASAYPDGNTYLGDAAPDKEYVFTLIYDGEGNVADYTGHDGTKFSYANGLISSVIYPDNTSTNYTYITDDLNNIISVQMERDGLVRYYDNLGNLSKIVTPDMTELNYFSGRLDSITTSDGRAIKNLAFDPQGDLSDALIILPDGTSRLYKDKELINIIGVDGLNVDYTDGQINNITDSDGNQYLWSYELDADGQQVLRIEDVVGKTVNYYKDGYIQRSVDQFGITTEYQYNDENKVSFAFLKKDNEVLNTYSYTYQNNITTMTDDSGLVRNYGLLGRVVSMTTADRKTCRYTYAVDEYGDELTTMALEKIVDGDGTVTQYKNGAIYSIILPNGAIFDEVVCDDKNKLKEFKATLPDGTIHIIKDNDLYQTIKPDGTTINYYDNGFIKSVNSTTIPSELITTQAQIIQNKPLDFIAGEKINVVTQEPVPTDALTTKNIIDSYGPFLNYFTGIGATQRSAQGFKLTNDARVGKISLNLNYKSGALSALTLRIEKDLNGKPSGELVCPDAEVTIAGFANPLFEWKDFVFKNPIELEANTQYHMVLRLQEETGNAAYSWMRANANGTYYSGTFNVRTPTYPNWYTYAKDDLAFRIYGEESLACRVVESYEIGINSYGAVSAAYRSAQSVTLQETAYISKVSLNMWLNAGPAAPLIVRIETDEGYLPSGELVSPDAEVEISPFSNTLPQWMDVVFKNPITLNKNVRYHIVVRLKNETGATYYKWARHATYGVYAKGYFSYATSGKWATVGKDDLYFRLYENNDLSIQDQTPKPYDVMALNYESGANNSIAVAPTQQAGQGITFSQNTVINKASLCLRWISGSLAGALEVRIETDSGGRPSGILAGEGASGIIEAFTDTSYVWKDVAFSSSVELDANKRYYIILKSIDGTTSTGGYQWARTATYGTSPGGNMIFKNATYPNWYLGYTRCDLYFRLYTTKLSEIKSPAITLATEQGDICQSYEAGVNQYAFVQSAQRDAQGITLPKDTSISKIALYLMYNSGFPTPLEVRIETDLGGRPSGQLVSEWAVTTCDTFERASYDWEEFIFNAPVILYANTKYHIVIKLADETTSAKYKWARAWTNGKYSGGLYSTMTSAYPNWYQYTPDDLYFRLYDSVYEPQGTFTSQPIELKPFKIESVSWNEFLYAGNDVTFAIRTGDAAIPDATWSDWSQEMTGPAGSLVNIPQARYLQYRVTMSTTDPKTAPRLYTDGHDVIKINYTQLAAPGSPLDTVEDYKATVESHKLSDQESYGFVYRNGEMDVSKTPGGLTTYYQNGRVSRVVDNTGNVIIQYDYDASGALIKVELPFPRIELERQIALSQADISQQKDVLLTQLAEEAAKTRQSIAGQTQAAQSQIDFERKRVQSYLGNPSYDQASLRKTLASLDTAQANLNANTLKAYQGLEVQIAQAAQNIENQTQGALDTLYNHDRNVVLEDIAVKETLPIVYFYYREVLGRDAGDSEIEYWTDKAKASLAAVTYEELAGYLNSSDEYSQRTQAKAQIISGVSDYLNRYMDPALKGALISELGLDASKLTDLSREDVSKILEYLNSRSLHFGDSAIGSLKEVLEDSGIVCTKEEIGALAITIDVLCGVITPETDGDLLLSMFALRETARNKGLSLYNTKLTYEDLLQIFPTPNAQPPTKVIVHINNDHFVTVTEVLNETVTYIETNTGANGETKTVSKEEFLKVWNGYTIVKSQPLDGSKLISDINSMNIRGAGWWSDFWGGVKTFFKKYAPIIALVLLPFAPMILGGLSVAIGALGSSIGSVLGGIGSALSAFAPIGSIISGVGQAIGGIIGAIGSVVGAVGHAIGVVMTGLGQIAGNIFGAVGIPLQTATSQTLLGSILSSVRDVAINIGLNKGFTELGLNPTAANIASAFLSGGITAGFAGQDIIAGAMRSGTIATVTELGEEAGLDSTVTGLAAITAGALTSGVVGGLSVQDVIKDIAPNIAGELAYIGVQKLGEKLGVDPRISYIAGAGIRSTVTAGLSNEFKPDVIWGSVQQGLLRGATSLGMEWAMDKLDVDPLLGVVISRAAAGAIEGLLTKTGLLNGAVTGLIDAGIKTLTLGGLVEPPDPYSSFYKAHPDLLNQAWAQYYWNDALHASQMLNLSHLIEERGLAPAIESVASSIFLSETLDSIWRQGGIADLITGTAVITHNEKKDIDVKRVFLNADHTDYIDFTVDGKDIVAIKQGNIYENSTFFYGPDGKPYPINSTKWIDNVDGTQTVNHIMDFKLTLSEKYDADGIMIEAIYPRAGQDGIIINHYTGKVLDGHVIDFENGYEYTVNQGKMVEFIDKKFFSRDNNRGFLGVGGAYFSKELGFDEYQNADLNNFILKITENNGDVNVSVDLTSPDSVTLETLSTWGKLTNYVKNYLLPGISQSQEIYGGQYMQIPTGANSYMIVDKTQGYAPVEIYQNGFKIMGELELSGGARVINGGIVYDIGQSSYLVAKIDNGSPTYIQYRGSSSLAVFNGQKDLNDKLINGELTVMGRDVIVFQNGTPIGYYKTGDPNHSIKPLDYDKMVSLVTGIFDSNGQISQNGIGNGMPNGVEPDFLAYHNAIFTQHNELFGDKPITKDATLPVFLNSEAGLPIESLHQAYDLVRDTIFGVALNQAIDHLTNETRVAFNDRYANSSDYNPFEGYSRIFESGSKTSSIRQVNEDYGRVYTMIGVSGNMSDKISNP